MRLEVSVVWVVLELSHVIKIKSNTLRSSNKRPDTLTRRKLGLPSALVERTCQYLNRQGNGLILSSSGEAFGTRAKVLMEECDSLQRSEKGSPPMVDEHFRAHKPVDMQTRMARYVMKGLGLGDKPYQQNIPESINDMLKDWSNFFPQDMDKFIVSA